jgi:hypothetical protein
MFFMFTNSNLWRDLLLGLNKPYEHNLEVNTIILCLLPDSNVQIVHWTIKSAVLHMAMTWQQKSNTFS